MAPQVGERRREVRVGGGHAVGSPTAGQEGVVPRLHEQHRHANVRQMAPHVGTGVVVVGSEEAVQRCRDGVVEIPERARGECAVHIDFAVQPMWLGAHLALQRAQEIRAVGVPHDTAGQASRATRQIIRHRHRDGGGDSGLIAAFAQVLQEHVAAEAEARGSDRDAGVEVPEPADHVRQVTGLA